MERERECVTVAHLHRSATVRLVALPLPCSRQGAGFRVQGSGFRVQGSGFRIHGSGLRVEES